MCKKNQANRKRNPINLKKTEKYSPIDKNNKKEEKKIKKQKGLKYKRKNYFPKEKEQGSKINLKKKKTK